MPKKSIKQLREGGILDRRSYSKYNAPSLGGKNARVAYFECAMCKLNRTGRNNIASLVDEKEYGIHKFAEMLWCDWCYDGFFTELQGEL